MDPFSYIFEAASQLTGGLVTDIKTAFLGILVIGFILIGLDYLRYIFERFVAGYSFRYQSGITSNLRKERDLYDRGSYEYDFFNAAYRRSLRKTLNTFDERRYRD